MNKQAKIALIAVFLVLGVLLLSFVVAAPKASRMKGACRDGIDNDGDGYVDWRSDPGCSNKWDNSELNPNVECDDGIDNDGDGAIDSNDNDCTGPTDNKEMEEIVYEDTCSETDWGMNQVIFGITSGNLDGQNYSNSDYCITDAILKENYCMGDYAYSLEYPCADTNTTSCANGACI